VFCVLVLELLFPFIVRLRELRLSSQQAPGVTGEVHDDALSETSMDIVVRSPEIQDAEPIHSAPMSETAMTSRDGL
jgi:hypothetical protein